ncbi:MAG: hypothetical protein GY755_21745 [Chloroflexi bacterium]|nr:hypothetical protein [Chloroflexota bacterium]
MELEITWKRTVKIWWSYLWRNLIAIVVASIIGGIIGGILGFIMGAMGVSLEIIQLVSAPIGGIIGLLISIFPMRLILGKDFGEFRLVLVKSEDTLE